MTPSRGGQTYQVILTYKKRPACITCAQGKQTRNNQSPKDTVIYDPIDRVGALSVALSRAQSLQSTGFIIGTLLISWITKEKYCRVFLAKTEDKATESFEKFLVYSENRFDSKIHYLRTDGGSEYRVVDLFCENSGGRCQLSEAGNQASNGKAELHHQTVMKMLSSIWIGAVNKHLG